MTLRAPFPWFGGKSRAAALVWPRFGDPHNYVEPFAGSLAVLLQRPHASRVETVNDLDCYLANFWRALQHDPDGVAYYADAPVNEADLHARHRWLVQSARERAERVMTDPDFYDVQIAGWWVWGQCLWIGSGWCQSPGLPKGRAGDGINQKRRPQLTHDQGVATKRHANGANSERIAEWNVRPDLSSANGRGGILNERTAATRSGENPSEQRKRFRGDGAGGVHAEALSRKRFAGTGNGQGAGVHRRWQGGGERGGGSGVHAVGLTRQKPRISAEGGSISGVTASTYSVGAGDLLPVTVGLYEYLGELSARLRRVRVCCGDWSRVLTPSVTTYIGTTAVFLDPPYAQELRERCYSEDHNVSAAVRTWAIEHGDDPKLRIALCGYEGEHAMPESWACVPWKAHGGYSRSARAKANRERERIWFSPHCLKAEPPLFERVEAIA